MNILYIHGWGSSFDPHSEKSLSLAQIGNVYGIDLDYTQPLNTTINLVLTALTVNDIDLVVGTSMGGYMANLIGNKYSIPYVMINPAIDPATTLSRYAGHGYDFNGNSYNLSHAAITQYPEMSMSGNQAPALLLLDMADELLDPSLVINLVRNSSTITTHTWEGGSHRFDHMDDALDTIRTFDNTNSSYGFGDN